MRLAFNGVVNMTIGKRLRKWMDEQYNTIGDPESFVQDAKAVLEFVQEEIKNNPTFASYFGRGDEIEETVSILDSIDLETVNGFDEEELK